jgi:hypothetical protein
MVSHERGHDLLTPSVQASIASPDCGNVVTEKIMEHDGLPHPALITRRTPSVKDGRRVKPWW